MLNVKNIIDVGPAKWLFRTLKRQYYKRIIKRESYMILPTGCRIKLPLDSHFSSEVFVTKADVDWGSEDLLFAFLEKRGAFLDVGSHIGYYALYMMPRSAAVFAFEPDPRARIHLEENLRPYPSAKIVPLAVGNQSGVAKFVLEKTSAVSHLACDAAVPAGTAIEVEIVTLDDFVEEKQIQVEAIKIDVEGFDLDVLKGARKTLLTQAPLVLTEAPLDSKLIDFVGEIGYEVFAFCRSVRSRQRTFQRLDRLTSMETKMLFLVPRRLREEFAARCG